MNEFKAYVLRDTENDGSVRFALVTYVADKSLRRSDLRDRIADATSAFCHKCKEANEDMQCIGGFDIGDLAKYVGWSDLEVELAVRGLHKVQIRITDFFIPVDDDWYYDYCLVCSDDEQEEKDT